MTDTECIQSNLFRDQTAEVVRRDRPNFMTSLLLKRGTHSLPYRLTPRDLVGVTDTSKILHV
jgi:hypothetical protein